jgi:hypothetical protein
MVDDIIRLVLACGGTAIAMRMVGFTLPRRTSKQMGPVTVCGCKHDYAMHDLRTGECHDKVKRPSKYDEYGSAIAWTYETCTCHHYTGPIPLDQVFTPPPLMPRKDKP